MGTVGKVIIVVLIILVAAVVALYLWGIKLQKKQALQKEQMDAMVRRHPEVTFVAAHPGESTQFHRHLQRMKMSENYYLDVSGAGLFRHRMLRYGIDACGAHRFLFGSDYPTCNPAMFIGGVALDILLTEEEKQLVFAENAKRILNL